MTSAVGSREGHRLIRGPGPQGEGAHLLRERSEGVTAVPPSEGNEARRDGAWGVGVPS